MLVPKKSQAQPTGSPGTSEHTLIRSNSPLVSRSVADTVTSRAAGNGATTASSAAIVQGFRAAFAVGAGLALLAAIMSWVLLREPNAE
ncbi:MAG: hypothetical protein ACXWP6_15615 [Ktedonobacterales bacterium]